MRGPNVSYNRATYRKRRSAAIVASVIAAVLLLGSLGAPAATAVSAIAARSKPSPSVSLALSKSTIGLGREVTVSGRVRVSGHNVSKAKVTVLGKAAAATTWKTLGKVKTKSNGKFSLTFKPSVGYSVRVKVAATKKSAAHTSAIKRLAVAPVLSSVSPSGFSRAVLTRSKFFTGKASSALAKRRVALNVLEGTIWKRVAETRFDDSGRFSFEIGSAAVGQRSYRIYVPADGGLTSLTSGTRVVETVRNSAVLRDTESCYGAAAFVNKGCTNSRLDGLMLPTTDSADLKIETGGAYLSNCWSRLPYELVKTCRYGSSSSDAPRIALVGDSHAAGYVPALRDQITRRGWQMDTFLGITCRWMELADDDPCQARSVDLDQRLRDGDYDLIVYTGVRELSGKVPDDVAESNAAEIAASYSGVWGPMLETGVAIVAIEDFGFARDLSCVTEAVGQEAAGCVDTPESMFRGIDPIPLAVEQTPGARMIDLTSMFCSSKSCPLVQGNVVVYRDAHHLTGMYAETLGPYLADKIAKELDR